MRFFDRIEQRKVNGLRELFAIDEQKNEAYLLRSAIITTEASAIVGNWLFVNSIKRRTSFENINSMNDYAEFIQKQVTEVDIANNKKF